jgi:hypothetical protein
MPENLPPDVAAVPAYFKRDGHIDVWSDTSVA